MKMLSGKMHWLAVGLALLVTAGKVHAQGYPAPPMGMQGEMPMHSAMPGPIPMEVAMERGYPGAGTAGGCDSGGGCDSLGGGYQGRFFGGRHGGAMGQGLGGGCMGDAMGMGGAMGGMGGGIGGGGGCGNCGGRGCFFCGAGNSCLGSGRLMGLLGVLAPYSEGGAGAQRWFDLSVGTIALARTSNIGSFTTPIQDLATGAFASSDVISTNGINGTPVLRSTDVGADKLRYGLEAIGNIQTGPGAHVEVRYFGLNRWTDSKTARLTTPSLFSIFSIFGTDPLNGFDDTDRSFIHTISLRSSLNNGEVNYRRQLVPPMSWAQFGWLMGIRYLQIDEKFGFAATGSNDNTFTFNQLRFFNYDTSTRNQLTGFQVGGNFWLNVVPGWSVGVEGKSGVYGNHADVDALTVANSIPGAREHITDGRTAYVTEFVASSVYRLTYSWSIRGSYNMLYVDNIALAQENFNTRDFSNAVGLGTFTPARFPFINTDGEALYQGFSLAGEYLF